MDASKPRRQTAPSVAWASRVSQCGTNGGGMYTVMAVPFRVAVRFQARLIFFVANYPGDNTGHFIADKMYQL